MSFDYAQFDLPIVSVIPEIKGKLTEENTLILSAPPGAGKSTLLPLALFESDWLKGQKILMLEPRRLAAKTIATRLADLLGEPVGQTVGYRIRFETKISAHTRIEIITEGILTRILQADNALEGTGMVIFDEFHERSIHADLALALARESQSILRPDLRLLIMSATLDLSELQALLKAPLIESKGRQYPVDIIYTNQSDEYLIAETTAQVISRAVKEQSGDILVFMPGAREIKNCAQIVQRNHPEIKVHELYGRLPYSVQQAAILPHKNGLRKVVIATDIAETSLTIQGVTTVVDSGWKRSAIFNPKTGLSGLETHHITKDSADQRAGRAGRLSPGVCYRLWSKGQQAQLKEHRVPEIQSADLTSLTLDLVNWGVTDANALAWLQPPPKYAIEEATKTLESLTAIENNRITDHGKKMQALPCHPRIAHLLLMAEEEGNSALATDIAAILEEKDPLPKEAGIDINLRIEALRRQRQQNKLSGAFHKIERIARQYREMLKIEVENTEFDPPESGLLLVYAYPERIAFARPGNNAQFQLANGAYAMAGHQDDLAYESWLAVAHMHTNSKIGRIFLAAPLNPIDLKPFLKTIDSAAWNTKKGGVIAVRETRIGSIVLKSTPLPNPDKIVLAKAISEAIAKEGSHLLNFNDEVKQWQNRVMTLRQLKPDGKWPNVSTTHLIKTNSEWLSPYLAEIKKVEDLKKIDLTQVLAYSLDHAQRAALEKLAPKALKVPSGSTIKINYQENGSTPILAVRLQEVFGLVKTPTINNGQTPLIMHLLSPGFKVVQITNDLASFWENAYFEIRKELRSRYKKHAWPENPLDYKAIKGTKKQNNLT